MSWESGAVAVGGPAAVVIVGYLTHKRSLRVDKITEQSGVTTESRAGTAQIIEGLNQLIDNVQEDNQGFRDDLRACAARLDEVTRYMSQRIEDVTRERDELTRKLNRMYRKHGNGDTPPAGTPTTSPKQ